MADGSTPKNDERLWLVELTCCGHDNGNWLAKSWAEADEFRECYTSGMGARPYGRPDLWGHERSGRIVLLPDPSLAGGSRV